MNYISYDTLTSISPDKITDKKTLYPYQYSRCVCIKFRASLRSEKDRQNIDIFREFFGNSVFFGTEGSPNNNNTTGTNKPSFSGSHFHSSKALQKMNRVWDSLQMISERSI